MDIENVVYTNIYTHTMKYYSAIKKKKSCQMPRQTDLEGIMLNEINQRKINTIQFHLHVESKNTTN